MSSPLLHTAPEVADALASGRPVVALESTLIAHGLPYPINMETAHAAEAAVREEGAIPATIAIMKGCPKVGLTNSEIELLANQKDVIKASRRDLAAAITLEQTAATTVSATMLFAAQAGIRVFATGGIGGAHRGEQPFDISADLTELARTPVAVICAGAKGILDLPRTLEILETLGVPVIGFGTDEFPAFYVRSSGEQVSIRADEPKLVARILQTHWGLGGAGVVVAQPVEEHFALTRNEFDWGLREAEAQAASAKVRGPGLTPYLLARLAEITNGKTLSANRALIIANARLAARISIHLA